MTNIRLTTIALLGSTLLAPWSAFAGQPAAAAAQASPGSPSVATLPSDEDTTLLEWFNTGFGWSGWTRMTGTWAGLRSRLDAHGIAVRLSNTADISGFPPAHEGATTVGRALTDVGVTFDLARLAGADGWTGYVQYFGKGGGDGSWHANDIQGFSNIDADDFRRIGEAWVESWLVKDRLRMKVGRVDSNTEYAFVENGAEFIQSSMGFSPSIFTLPTYPEPTLAANVFVKPHSMVDLSFGIYNGNPALGLSGVGSPFFIQELGVTWGQPHIPVRGRIGIGTWFQRGEVTREDGASGRGADGRYLVFDQTLWQGGPANEPRRVAMFLQGGWVNSKLVEIRRHVGGGLVASGFVPGMPADTIGAAVTTVSMNEWAQDELGARETTTDIFYKHRLAEWVSIKADLQHIARGRCPLVGGVCENRPALVPTVRFEIEF